MVGRKETRTGALRIRIRRWGIQLFTATRLVSYCSVTLALLLYMDRRQPVLILTGGLWYAERPACLREVPHPSPSPFIFSFGYARAEMNRGYHLQLTSSFCGKGEASATPTRGQLLLIGILTSRLSPSKSNCPSPITPQPLKRPGHLC
jgi:hypothetical protein